MEEILAGAGFLILLSAFRLNVAGRVDRSSLLYDGLNAAGAAILSWYAVAHRAPIFVLLQVTWFLVAIASLLVKLSKLRKTQEGARDEGMR